MSTLEHAGYVWPHRDRCRWLVLNDEGFAWGFPPDPLVRLEVRFEDCAPRRRRDRTAPCCRTGAAVAMTWQLFRLPRPTVLATSACEVLHRRAMKSMEGAADSVRCAARSRGSSRSADVCCWNDGRACCRADQWTPVRVCTLPCASGDLQRLRPRAALLQQAMQRTSAACIAAQGRAALSTQLRGRPRPCPARAGLPPAQAPAAGAATATATATAGKDSDASVFPRA
jgi:hypothetical protein